MEGGARTSENEDTVHVPNVVERPRPRTAPEKHLAVALFENVDRVSETLSWNSAKRVPTCFSTRRELFLVEVEILGESKASLALRVMTEVPKSFCLFPIAEEHL